MSAGYQQEQAIFFFAKSTLSIFTGTLLQTPPGISAEIKIVVFISGQLILHQIQVDKEDI